MAEEEAGAGEVAPNEVERAAAARAHLGALLNVVPLLGVFAAMGVFRGYQGHSAWGARQALQAAIFQLLAFNVGIILVTLAAVIGALAWESRYSGGDLVLAVALTALPFYAAYYLAQASAGTRMARQVRRGRTARYPIAGRLAGVHRRNDPVKPS